MWATLLALVLVGYLPGALLYRLPVAGRERRAALAADERAFWAIVLSLAWSSAVVLSLAALGLYRFGLLLTVNAIVSALAALAGRGALLYRGAAPRPVAWAIVPVLVAAAGIRLFFPPSEYVMGGKDPGTYMNEGIQIAQRGAIMVDDPVVAAVPRAYRDLFFPSHHNPTYYGVRFMGFFIRDPDRGTVVGQFPHLYPASIAIGYGLNGLSGARQAVGVWAILGLLAVYYAGVRLLGRWPAAAAAALLLANVITLWFARYPNAEVAMQALAFAALVAADRALVDGDRFFGAVSGALLGLLLFLRFDAVLAVGAAGAAAMASWADGRRMDWWFWLPLGALIGLAWLYLAGPMAAYSAFPFFFIRNQEPWLLAAGAAAAIVAYRAAARRPALAGWLRRAVPVALACALSGLALYAWFLREPAGRLAWHDAMALRSFGWYVTPAGVAAAASGMALLILRRFWAAPALLTAGAAYGVFFFYKIRIVPQHFWMARRFLPVILPMACLAIAGLAFWLAGPHGLQAALRRRRARIEAAQPPRPGRWREAAGVAAALVLVAPLGWHFWGASRPVRHHVEYAGLIPRLERLAQQFGDNDLVIVESRNASDAHVLALPLAYIYARQVLVLNTPRPDPVAFAGFLDWARERYAAVYFLGGGGTELLSRRVAVEAVAGERFQIPEYDSPVNALPAGVRQKEFDYSVYRFVPPTPAVGPFVLDIGTRDDLLVVRFHAKERHRSDAMTFRWTRDVSYVSIPAIPPAAGVVTVWMGDGGRPASLGPVRVRVSLDDRLLGEATLTSAVQPYTFAIPPEVASRAARRDAPARIAIAAPTWRPREALGVPDDRELGVLVDRIEVR